MKTPKVGLLPFYIALYDQIRPETRHDFEPLLRQVRDGLAAEGLEVVAAPICCVRSEFDNAVSTFNQQDVDAIVTLHLAYSPSLESIDALAAARRPLIVLDTTMDESFGPEVDPARIMYNHGIHGVQDMCTMLRVRGVPFEIVAGHVAKSDVIRRAADLARAARAAANLRNMRAVRLGPAFVSMGDFAVPERTLRRVLGIHVEQATIEDLAEDVRCVTDTEVQREVREDQEKYRCEAPTDVHARSVRVGLGVRRFLEKKGAGAFSFNFQSFTSKEPPVDTVPFLEASKAMARGMGYAGEGDVMTASLVGALAANFQPATFTEIFCPDWRGNSLFISHMGEMNPLVAAGKPRLFEKPYTFSATNNPAVLTCAPAPGSAVLVNLAPGPEETFRLILAPVEVLGDSKNRAFQDSVRGWLRPTSMAGEVAAFLEQYSRLGGTHHSALVMGDRLEALRAFAGFAGIECSVIR